MRKTIITKNMKDKLDNMKVIGKEELGGME